MEFSATNLSVARGGLTVLSGLSFGAGEGQALLFTGPNGAGKTTLLRTLAGLQPQVAGDINQPPESITYAAHADGVKAVMTVSENLTFWASIHGTKGIDLAITRMNLTALAHRRAGELSAGQKRRLGLARLLVTGRPIWLLDEPTVSLDTASVALFAGVVRDHLATGGIALLASHIDLGLPEARVMDLAPYRSTASTPMTAGFDEAFL